MHVTFDLVEIEMMPPPA